MFNKFREAAGAAVDQLGKAGEITVRAKELAASTANGTVNAANLRNALELLDYAPLAEQIAELHMLNASLAILQMGKVSLVAAYDESGPNAYLKKMSRITAEKANAIVNGEYFTSVTVSESDNPDEPDIRLLINTDNFAKNHKHLTADLIAGALMAGIETLPGGGIVAKGLHAPARTISRFVIGTIYEQAENAAGLALENKGQQEQAQITARP